MSTRRSRPRTDRQGDRARPGLVTGVNASRSGRPDLYSLAVLAVVERVAPARLGGPFRWLLASSWTTNLGDGIEIAAGPLLVASLTSDPFLISLAALLQIGRASG